MSYASKRSWAARLRLMVLVGILLGLQLRLWQSDGLFSAYRLQEKVAAQTEALKAEQSRNQNLANQLKWMGSSTAAIEHHARQSLGMIKPGETFYLLVEDGR